MSVRIGKIELSGVQEFHTEESRTLVQQRVPEQQGNVFQDLGREPVTVILDGLLFTADALNNLEKLRDAQVKAKPLPLAADALEGTELTDVIIEDLRIRQLAGYEHRYRYTLRLREYKQAPQPADAAIKPVDQSVAKDADNFGKNSLAAAKVLKDPASLPDAVGKNPGLLDHIKSGDLASSITKNADGISGSTFSKILNAIKKIDPAKVIELISAMKDAGSLGKFLQKYADEGLDFIGDLAGVDLSKVAHLVNALKGGFEFLTSLKKIGDSVEKLVNDIKSFDPLASVKPLLEAKK